MASQSHVFRPMTADDLPIVQQWLGKPHVAAWWGDPVEQYALVRDDMSHPDMKQFIVEHARQPFAYLQCYAPNASRFC
jgi:aminoglycoside 6'-N-acetyltransferase